MYDEFEVDELMEDMGVDDEEAEDFFEEFDYSF
jgi:hypothetical protein